MKKTILSLLSLALLSTSALAQLNLFSGTDDVLIESWDSQGTIQYMTLDKVASANACGAADELEVDYASPSVSAASPPTTTSYWAGNGAYNVNNWGAAQIDFSAYTHFEFKVKYTGSNPENKLVITLIDSGATAGNTTDGIDGVPIEVTGTEAATCITKSIALSTIAGSTGINFETISLLQFAIDGFAWHDDDAIEGSGTGTFYVDDIRLTNGTTSSVANSASAEAFTVSPNPSNGLFTVNGSNEINTIVVSDALGNIVLTSSSNQVDLSTQPTGLYFLTITTNNNNITVKKVSKN
jgi:hypothetical protein